MRDMRIRQNQKDKLQEEDKEDRVPNLRKHLEEMSLKTEHFQNMFVLKLHCSP